jgi:hypothetical protein
MNTDPSETPVSCAEYLNSLEEWFLTVSKCLELFLHSIFLYIVAICHKLNICFVTFWQALIHTTLWDLHHVGIYEWTSKHTFSRFPYEGFNSLLNSTWQCKSNKFTPQDKKLWASRVVISYCTDHTGACGCIVGWATMLQAGRLWVRFSMRSLDFFFNLPNPSRATMALGSTQPLTEMSTRNIPVYKADNLTGICEPIV